MKVDTFKKLLGNYYNYQIDEVVIKEDIDNLWYELSGIKAISYDKQPTSFNEHLNEIYKLDLLDKLEEKQLELEMVQSSIKVINLKLSKLSEEDKNIIKRILCDKESNEKVGLDAGYTHNAMWKKVKRTLEGIL